MSISGAYFKRFLSDESGSISIIGYFSIIPLIGIIAFAVEVGNFQASRLQSSVVADASALSAALSYASENDVSTATSVANSVAAAAGIDITNVVLTVIPSPRDASEEAIEVKITARQDILLGRIFGSGGALSVASRSVVEVAGGLPSCIITLSGGVTVDNNSNLTATACGVASVGDISASGLASLSAQEIVSNGSVGASGFIATVETNPQPNQIRQNVSDDIEDPYAGNSDVNSELFKVGNASSPVIPTVPMGQNFTAPSSLLASTIAFDGMTVTYNGTAWEFPAGTYHFQNLTADSNNIVFRSPSVVTVSGTTIIGGNANITFDGGDFTSTGELRVVFNASFTAGDGRFHFDSINSTSNGNITFGDGDFDVADFVSIGGNTLLTAGTGNKVIGGNVTIEDNAGGITFGDGNLDIGGHLTVGSNASFTFGTPIGANPGIYIDGDLTAETNSIINFAPARYYIDGDFRAQGNSNVSGDGVNFFLSGLPQISANANSVLRPPASDGSLAVSNLIFATRSNGTASVSANGRFNLSGSVYAPNADFEVLDSAELNLSSNRCLQLVVRSLHVEANARFTADCPNLSEEFLATSPSPVIVG